MNTNAHEVAANLAEATACAARLDWAGAADTLGHEITDARILGAMDDGRLREVIKLMREEAARRNLGLGAKT